MRPIDHNWTNSPSWSTSDRLPKGWKAVASAQGTYYYNAKTKETTWDRPGGEGVAIGMPPPGPPPPGGDVPPPVGPPPPVSSFAPSALEAHAESGYNGYDGGGRGSMVVMTPRLPSIMTPPPPAPPPPGGAALPPGWEEVTTAAMRTGTP